MYSISPGFDKFLQRLTARSDIESFVVEKVDTDYMNLEKIPHLENSADNLTKIMLKAHTELIKLNETNKELFKDVIEYLEKDANGSASF